MSQSIDYECIRVPVTALAFCDQYLFAAEGPFLQLFHHKSSKLTASQQIFRKQAIHGILICSQSDSSIVLLIHGGCYVRLLRLHFSKLDDTRKGSLPQEEFAIFHLSLVLKCPDWILDVRLAPSSISTSSTLIERRTVAAITAHNALLRLNLKFEPSSTPTATDTLSALEIHLDELTASSRCILYAAHLSWTSANHILIAAGTAFGEILVWSWSESHESSSSAQLHHVFTGHEGSVFGVQISEKLVLEDDTKVKRLLASCSDDRSIRIWDISELPIINTLDSPHERETGFGANLPITGESDQLCLAIGWGHSSRVWTVQFLKPGCIAGHSVDAVQMISTGEDATSRIWDLVPKETHSIVPDTSTLPFNLKEIRSAAFHTGKNMWSLSLDYSREQLSQIVTGAADSKIIMYFPDAKTVSTTNTTFDDNQTMEDIVGSIQSSKKTDIFRSYSFIAQRLVLLTTNEGRVITRQTELSSPPARVSVRHDGGGHGVEGSSSPPVDVSKSLVSENRITSLSFHQIPTLKGYSITASLASHEIAFFAGTTGDVYAIPKSSSPKHIYSAGRKVGGLFPHKALRCDKESFYLLVTLIGGPQATLLLLSPSKSENIKATPTISGLEAGEDSSNQSPASERDSGLLFSVVEEIPLSIPGQSSFVATSTTIAQTQGAGTEEYMFVGSRSGSVACYALPATPRDTERSDSLLAPLVDVLPNVHGKETVTSMIWKSSANAEEPTSSGYLISVGRDGSCAAHQVDFESGQAKLVHKTNLPFGPNIEGVYVRNENLMVYGFRGTQFILLDESNEEEVMTVECGGAHRNWAFDPSPSGPGGTLVWTQAANMRVCHRGEASHKVLRSGGHGREIKAVAVSPHIPNNDGSIQLIATGAEDTDIKIFEYTSHGLTSASLSSLRCLRTLRKHMTGIQHLAWSEDGKYLFSSGGREEFFVWRIRMLPIIGVGVVCEAVCESESDVPDLRIMSFSVRKQSVEDVKRPGRQYVISMAYSDSTIRIYSYIPSSPSPWSLLHTGVYLTSCLTHSIFLSPQILLTSGTDGHVAFWDFSSDPLIHSSRTKIHQNTAKTLAYQPISPEITLLVTGGDDGALGVTLIRLTAEPSSPNVSTLLVPRAHTAAVTACAFLPTVPTMIRADADSDQSLARELQLVTSGTDQRVILWIISIDCTQPGVEGLDVRNAGKIDTAVADVADLAILDADGGRGVGVVVCGVGMQVFRISALGG
ncbi:WD40 repeat-like protein [Mytilinidion resinicola]|uniref:WD40 repeat-like protein n=1 Tax=Mytilinidion resinicola TaxID=574789 RepID=A0A6A6Z0R3_9PEZI|nr:WD40 repeat-like protein [Mytilinidion resinicola]KAF2814610.1 WD40 repeat-like protein [Mytilinidion resinicola]